MKTVAVSSITLGWLVKLPSIFAGIVIAGFVCTTSNAQMLDTDLTGSSQAHANMPPYAVLNYRIATDADLFSASDGDAPTLLGEVRAFTFSNDIVMSGWTIADGRLLDIASNADLFAVLGTSFGGNGTTDFALPDLRSRVPICSGGGPSLTAIELGEKIGSETVRLTQENLFGHTHTTPDGPTESTGGGTSHQNLAPSLGLHCVLVVRGSIAFPNRNGDGTNQPTPLPMVDEIKLYAGLNPNFSELESCLGQTLPISQNAAAFSIVGTNYGGDGRTTFGIPDLRGRSIVQYGITGGGIPNSVIGQKRGISTVALSLANLPAHQHDITNSDPLIATGLAGGGTAHDNQSPYLAITAVVTTSDDGLPPSTVPTVENMSTPIIGQVRYFAGNFAPSGHVKMEGTLLPVDSFETLESLLGTAFGGDGTTTFGVPNTINRLTIGGGTGSGLSQRTIGDIGGTHEHTLLLNELARHRHGEDINSFCWFIKTTSAGASVCL